MEAHEKNRRPRQFLTAAAAAVAIAAVPAGIALADSGGQSSGSDAQAPSGTLIQEQGESPRGDGDRRDGHDCPKDREGGSESSTTQL